MIGTKLRQRKSQVRRFLRLYVLLALAGGTLAGFSLGSGQRIGGAAGFLVVFGAGMAVSTLLRGRRAQVSVHADFVEVDQGRSRRTLRYRNITAVSRPDANRLVVTLREDEGAKNEVIWLRDLEPEEVKRLQDFLRQARGRRTQ